MPLLGNFTRPTKHLPPPRPEETLVWMARLAQKGQYDSRLRLLAEKITANIFEHDYLSEYMAILNWVRVNVRYSRDPRTIEQLKEPHVIVETGTGDCDDMAVLIAALIGQIGGRVRFVAGAMKGAKKLPSGRPVLSHVWAEAFDPSSKCWVVLDPVPGRKVHQMLGRVIHTITHAAIE